MPLSKQSKSDQRNLFLFFILSFAFTWVLDIPRLLDDNNIYIVPEILIFIQKYFAVFGPFFAAFILVYKAKRWEGIKQFWKRGWDFQFEKKWLLYIFIYFVVFFGFTILVMQITENPIQWQYSQIPLPLIIPIFLAIFLTNALPEEYGWRGYALDKLQIRWNAFTASLILGFIHGIWHLPLHFMRGTIQEIIPVWQFTLITMLGSVIYSWIYNNTNRNVFLVILFHALGNVLSGVIPYWVTNEGRWIAFGIQFILGLIIVLVFGVKNLSRKHNEL